MKFVYTILALIIMICLFQAGYHMGLEKGGTEADTVTIRDTLRPDPIEVHDTFLRMKVVALHDTITKDSLVVRMVGDSLQIPITQRTYSDDSTYTAWVSGYEPQLDSINFYRDTKIVREKPKQKFFDLGLGVTYGLSLITGKPDVTAGATVVIHF